MAETREFPKSSEFSFDLDNDPRRFPQVIERLMEIAAERGLFDVATRRRVALALHEAMVNAMQHGNLELDSRLRQGDEAPYQRLEEQRRHESPYAHRRLRVHARFEPDAAVFVIRDDGNGFDPHKVPDPTGDAALNIPSGRGLLLIRTFMDEVTFNPTGNEITLVKRRGADAPSGRR